MKRTLLFGCMLSIASSAVLADDLAPTRTETGAIDVKKDYRLEADLGYLVNNTESDGESTTTENLNFHMLYQRQKEVWGQEVVAEAVSSNADDAENNLERYLLSGKLLHRSSETVYQFAKLTAEKDLSSAFDYQLSLTGGIGKDFIKTNTQTLSAEIGAGLHHSKERAAPQDTLDGAICTVAAFYQYQITPSVRFNQDLSYEYGNEAQTLRSRTALSADLTQSFAAVASYNIKDTSADAGDSRDSLLSLGLRYKY